jgi:ABC-type multidrug transport system fused ATPase/permease subunit
VAIVGQSGSGKSTLLALLLRFHDPSRGTVRFDDYDVSQVTLASLALQVGAVFQDSFLFDASLADNIRLGRPEASDAEVEAAARAAGIHEFVSGLPQGYQAPAGEGGARLSGGQRQRIALARPCAASGRARLDEATSALDAETEAGHRRHPREPPRLADARLRDAPLATARRADLIVVMAEGRVAEQGTHESLLAAGGVYARLWEQQSGFVVSPSGREAAIQPSAWPPSPSSPASARSCSRAWPPASPPWTCPSARPCSRRTSAETALRDRARSRRACRAAAPAAPSCT